MSIESHLFHQFENLSLPCQKPAKVSGKLAYSEQLGYFIPFNKPLKDQLKIFNALFQELKNQYTHKRKEFKAEFKIFNNVFFPVLKSEDVEFLNKEQFSDTLGEGPPVTFTIKNLTSTFRGDAKVWQITVNIAEAHALRAKIGLPPLNQEGIPLIFAQKSPIQSLSAYIEGRSSEEKTIAKIRTISQAELTQESLHMAIKKKWFDLAAIIHHGTMVPFLKTLKACTSNCQMPATLQESLQAAYDRNEMSLQEALANPFGHMSLDEQKPSNDKTVPPASPVLAGRSPDLNFQDSSPQEALDVMRMPVCLLNATHLHQAVLDDSKEAIAYLLNQCIAPYKKTCATAKAKDDQSLFHALTGAYHSSQEALAIKYTEEEIDSILNRHTFENGAIPQEAKELEEEKYKILLTIPVSQLTKRHAQIAIARNWKKIQDYFIMQKIVDPAEVSSFPAIPSSSMPIEMPKSRHTPPSLRHSSSAIPTHSFAYKKPSYPRSLSSRKMP